MPETVTENKNLRDVQDRLMEMLDSVCLDPNAPPKDRPAPRKKKTADEAESTLKTTGSSKVKVCPNCRSEEPWGSSSWCPNCGYYPQLKRRVFSDELAEIENSEEIEEELDLTTMATMVPTWIYWLSGGIIFLLAESLTIRCLHPRLEQRSPIAIIQILIGLNVLGIAHLRAYFIAAHEDENFNFISIVWTPVRIWQTVITQMPRVRRTIYAGAWSLCALLFAILIIGVDYLSVMTPVDRAPRKPMNPMKMVLQVAGKMASSAPQIAVSPDGDIEDALEGFAGDSLFDTVLESGNVKEDPLEDAAKDANGQTGVKGSDSAKSDKDSGGEKQNQSRDIVWSSASVDGPREFDNEYMVIGYLTNSGGELRSLLLAEALKGSGAVRFAGKYSISTKDHNFIDKLQLQLEEYRSRYPAMKTPYIAKWTAPYVMVKIVHNGVAPDGRFTDGQILYYQNKPPR